MKSTIYREKFIRINSRLFHLTYHVRERMIQRHITKPVLTEIVNHGTSCQSHIKTNATELRYQGYKLVVDYYAAIPVIISVMQIMDETERKISGVV
jgi:hypothetical protein